MLTVTAVAVQSCNQSLGRHFMYPPEDKTAAGSDISCCSPQGQWLIYCKGARINLETQHMMRVYHKLPSCSPWCAQSLLGLTDSESESVNAVDARVIWGLQNAHEQVKISGSVNDV